MRVPCVRGWGHDRPHKQTKVTNDVITSQLDSIKTLESKRVKQPNWDLAKVLMFTKAKRGEILLSMD